LFNTLRSPSIVEPLSLRLCRCRYAFSIAHESIVGLSSGSDVEVAECRKVRQRDMGSADMSNHLAAQVGLCVIAIDEAVRN
jgi:hypothetical protein